MTILNHPEYGVAYSRTDGWFDMVVNGGGYFTVQIDPPAGTTYIPVQRQAKTRWLDYTGLGNIVLTPRNAAATVTVGGVAPTGPIANPAPAGGVVYTGTATTDGDGTRTPRLFIPQGATATILPAGSTSGTTPSTLPALDLTEFTTESWGLQAMPGPLPATSAYTFAIEIHAEGTAQGDTVQFSQPVVFYLDNFMSPRIQEGTTVPMGHYDTTAGQWVADVPSGMVVTAHHSGSALTPSSVSSVTGEAAVITAAYADGGQPRAHSDEPLHALGRQLGRRSSPDAVPPNVPAPLADQPEDDPCSTSGGSSIECQNRVLNEDITIAGTPFCCTTTATGRSVVALPSTSLLQAHPCRPT